MVSWCSRIFSSGLNPFYNLGNLAILMLIVACVSGLYIFLFYNVDPAQAYHSVEAISRHPLHGVVRTIHRYSSDLMILFIFLHFLHTWFIGKFRNKLSWVSGIVSLLFVLFLGVTGYILVWDEKAKLIGFLTARFFSALPIFDPAIAGSFISNNLEYVGGFFKVSLFGHIFFSVFILIIIWIHVLRLPQAKLFTPQRLTLYTLAALLLLSIIFPAKSDPPAQATFYPFRTTFDWFYFYGYYFLKDFSIAWNWVFMLGSGLLLALFPFFLRKPPRPEPARIELDLCDGCTLCVKDCPYDAIEMHPVNGERKAVLNASTCLSCGICVPSCHTHAITMPPLKTPDILAAQLDQAPADLAIYACSYFPEYTLPEGARTLEERVVCIGDVHARDAEMLLEKGVKCVALLGCEKCYHRLGKEFAIDRFNRKRAPMTAHKENTRKIVYIASCQDHERELKKLFDHDLVLPVIDTPEHKPRIPVIDNLKPRPLMATVLMFLICLGVPFLSSTRISFYEKDINRLILSFKYNSSPIEFEQIDITGKHMQLGKPIVRKRSNVQVLVLDQSGKELYRKIYTPRGMRHDIATFIYAEIDTREPFVDISLSEPESKKSEVWLRHVPLQPDDGTVITFANGRLERVRMPE